MVSRASKKYVLRFIFGLINSVLGTAGFMFVWYRFVSVNNQTGHLLGHGNLFMSGGIYFVLLVIVMNWIEEFGNYDAVLVNDIPDEQENKLIKVCFEIDKRIYFVPKISDVLKTHSTCGFLSGSLQDFLSEII